MGCTAIDLVNNLKIIRLNILFVDERLTQKPPLTPPSADVVSLLPAQSGVHKQNQSVSVSRRQEFLGFQPFCIRKHPQFLDRHIDLSCVPFVVLFLCQKKPLQIPRSFPVTVHSGEFDD